MVKHKELNIPLEFVTFAHIEGKLYKHFRNNGSFVLPNVKRKGSVVYGAIFLLRDFDFYIRLLDAYYMCSYSTLHTNHRRDIHHREIVQATPIAFSDLDSFSRLLYKEKENVATNVYYGNRTHPKINQRLNLDARYRIIDGVSAKQFTEIYREVTQ
jgi:hypothetical protein